MATWNIRGRDLSSITQTRSQALLLRFSQRSSVLVSLIAGAALAGWTSNLDWLKSWTPRSIAMNPLSAILLILGSISVIRWLRPGDRAKPDWLASGCALMVAVGGAVKTAEYLFHFDLNLDQWLFSGALQDTQMFPQNEIAPNTALNFLFCGAGLLLIDVKLRRGLRPAQILFLLTALISLLGLIGYAYRVLPLYRLGSAVPMSLNTAVAFELLALGALAARPDRGIMTVITSQTNAGAIARRLLPAAILVPLILGSLRFTSERRGLFEVEFGVSLFAVANMILFTFLIWWNAQLLFRAEQQRLRAERRLSVQYAATQALAKASHIGETMDEVLRVICEKLDWQMGALWTVDDHAGQIRCERTYVTSPDFSRFAEVSRMSTYAIGDGLPGRIWQERAPIWVKEIAEEKSLIRGTAATAAKLHSACGFPVRFNGTICGTVEFFSTRSEPPDEPLLDTLAGVGSQIGQFMERKHAEERLRQASADLERSNTDLQQFAYVASHDLSEPLRMIVSYLQLLVDHHRARLDAEAQEFIGYAVDGAQRMQMLISDLLAYARVERGRDFQMTDCEKVMQGVLQNLKLVIQENGAVIEHGPLPQVKADPIQLTQVFQNLISNAIKFHGSDPPRIRVSAERQGSEWLFSVQDNGIGIDPRNLERIFVLFQRLHTRQEYPGTGIGLAICKKIIERHGGRIWAESKAGQGTTFSFTLPVLES